MSPEWWGMAFMPNQLVSKALGVLGRNCGAGFQRAFLRVATLTAILSLVLSGSAFAAPGEQPIKPTEAPVTQPAAPAQPARPYATNGAIENLNGCIADPLDRVDDGGSEHPNLGFTINYFGTNYSSIWVNNNGHVTFDELFGGFTPGPIVNGNRKIIALFWADVDTRNLGSNVTTHGPTTFQGHQAYCVNWVNVGYYNSHADKLNSFQLLLVNRSETGAGNFDMILNYDSIQWETGDVNGGTGGLGGTSARAGFSNGIPASSQSVELPGSAINGAFLNGGPNALATHSLNSVVPGRYQFSVRSGAAPVGVVDGTVLLDTVITGPATSPARTQGTTPVANSRIQACRAPLENPPVCFITQSGQNGFYSLSGLPNGDYDLVAWAPAGTFYLSAEIFPVTIASGGQVHNVNPILRPAQGPPPMIV
jgi:hypothetical protein